MKQIFIIFYEISILILYMYPELNLQNKNQRLTKNTTTTTMHSTSAIVNYETHQPLPPTTDNHPRTTNTSKLKICSKQTQCYPRLTLAKLSFKIIWGEGLKYGMQNATPFILNPQNIRTGYDSPGIREFKYNSK